MGNLAKGKLIGKIATLSGPEKCLNAHSMGTVQDVLEDLLEGPEPAQ